MPSHDRSLVGVGSAPPRERVPLARAKSVACGRQTVRWWSTSSSAWMSPRRNEELPMAVETVPWNQCLLCILRLRRPPTSSSRPNRLERAPLPFPLRFVAGASSPPKRWPFPTPKLESWFPISRSSSAKGRASGLPLHLAVKPPPGLPAQRLSSCRLAMRHREGPRHLARRDDQGRLHACGVRSRPCAVSGNVRASCEAWSGVSLSIAPKCADRPFSAVRAVLAHRVLHARWGTTS